MKRPIDRAEIRKGDAVRIEYRDNDALLAGVTAREYKAGHDCDAGLTEGRPLAYFLLDRPEPAVELPTEGLHLGWLTHDGQADLLVFSFNRPGHIEDASYGSISRPTVQAWVPAVAVPKAALDALRFRKDGGFFRIPDDAAITNFLTAVDEANA